MEQLITGQMLSRATIAVAKDHKRWGNLTNEEKYDLVAEQINKMIVWDERLEKLEQRVAALEQA